MQAAEPTDAILRSLCAAQERHQLFPIAADGTWQPVVVGVSGGADSVCLLHLLTGVAARWQLALHVAHVDHSVRAGSAADARFVEELAQAWGLPFHLRTLSPEEVAGGDNNLETALRGLRYDFLAQVADSVSSTSRATVAVAHNADDQAETILMHILRGSGLAGLTGMRPVTLFGPDTTFEADAPGQNSQRPTGLRLARPLLDVSRTQILQYLNAHGLAWREDATNQDENYTRNRIRHQIFPALRQIYPNLTGALGRLGDLLAAENDRAEAINASALHTLRWDGEPTEETGISARIVLDRKAFRALDLATQRGVLRLAGMRLGVPGQAMDYNRTDRLVQSICAEENTDAVPWTRSIAWTTETERFSLHKADALAFPLQTPFLDARWRRLYGTAALAREGEIRVDRWCLSCREIDPADMPADWQTQSDPWQVWCDARHAHDLLLTTPRKGQRFAPMGMGGSRKTLGDFFTDRKIPVALRAGWPLLIDGVSGQVIWLCGLRLAHHVRIQPNTKWALHLQWRAD
ncbi:MAG: tRNA lysidine(34) synthetase TilS [Caldilineaceae bacterium]|nr:tRNA lysidine(34) synthetase TilS [Caldilineaceae bacterium]